MKPRFEKGERVIFMDGPRVRIGEIYRLTIDKPDDYEYTVEDIMEHGLYLKNEKNISKGNWKELKKRCKQSYELWLEVLYNF